MGSDGAAVDTDGALVERHHEGAKEDIKQSKRMQRGELSGCKDRSDKTAARTRYNKGHRDEPMERDQSSVRNCPSKASIRVKPDTRTQDV